ncbi:MAG TPA: universal stress protein, partial [Gemmatimonadales bacterium]|nr:universal stress protein [Gemmatimonadales bacterium]
MTIRHLVAATDDSAAGRHAVETATWLAARLDARLTVVTVTPVAGRDRIHTVAHPVVGTGSGGVATLHDRVVLTGLPGIEIVRYAEAESADLIVLGRSRRSSASRWLIGDTGDAVARRSSVPCLFVPPGQSGLTRVLVAVDGTERGLMVLRRA